MLRLTPDTHHALPQNVSKEAEKTAANIAEAAPVIGDRVSDRIGREAEQLGNETKPAAEKAAKRISSEAEQLGKEARPMADKASDNIEAGARQVGEQARPAADNASEAMRKTADDASSETKHYHCSCQSCVLCLRTGMCGTFHACRRSMLMLHGCVLPALCHRALNAVAPC